MLYTQTDKIKISTVGASFTVTFTVAPDEIGYLTALHEKYAEMNMCGFTIKPSDSEKPNNCVTCDKCGYLNVRNTKTLYAFCSKHGIQFKPFEDDTRTHYCAWGIKAEIEEKPNSCEDCKRWRPHHWESGCTECYEDCDHFEPKTEPQTDYRITDTIGYRCPKCGRGNFLSNESNCVYCGEPLIKTDCAWKGE